MLAHQHTEVMAEMEETFHDAVAAADGTSNRDAIELRRWQQWRNTEPAGLNANTTFGTGSAERPIEIDGAAPAAASAATDAGTATTTSRARGGDGGPTAGDAGAGGGAAGPAEGGEALWGHAVHEHELSPGDQVQYGVVFVHDCANACVCAGVRLGLLLPAVVSSRFYLPRARSLGNSVGPEKVGPVKDGSVVRGQFIELFRRSGFAARLVPESPRTPSPSRRKRCIGLSTCSEFALVWL